MNFEFNLRTKTIIGAGSIDKIIKYLEAQSYSKAGLIIDQSLKANDYINSFLFKIQETGKTSVIWYYDLPFEPDYESLDRIKLLFKEEQIAKVDILIAIGGGSVIDFTKGIATLITNHKPALNYRGFPEGLHPSIPVIAVPTTAGTASEVTFNAVFTDTNSERKLGINTHNNFPVVAILDAHVTKTCPFPVALSAGLDALVHTFESFATKNQNPYTRMFAVEAFKHLINNIERSLLDNTEEARENMLFGANLAGISLFNSGSGPAGALSYPLGVVFKVPHGIAGGFILPYLIKHNVDSGYMDYSILYDQIITADPVTDVQTKSRKLVKWMFDLYDRLGVWKQKNKYKIDPGNKKFEDYISVLQPAFNQNPVPFDVQDGLRIISTIFES